MKRPDRCTACGSLDIVFIVDGEDDYIECSSCGTTFDEVAVLVERKRTITLEQIEKAWARSADEFWKRVDPIMKTSGAPKAQEATPPVVTYHKREFVCDPICPQPHGHVR